MMTVCQRLATFFVYRFSLLRSFAMIGIRAGVRPFVSKLPASTRLIVSSRLSPLLLHHPGTSFATTAWPAAMMIFGMLVIFSISPIDLQKLSALQMAALMKMAVQNPKNKAVAITTGAQIAGAKKKKNP